MHILIVTLCCATALEHRNFSPILQADPSGTHAGGMREEEHVSAPAAEAMTSGLELQKGDMLKSKEVQLMMLSRDAELYSDVGWVDAPLSVLSVEEGCNVSKEYRRMWELTKPYRKAAMHDYAGYHGPWIENKWIETFMKDPTEDDESLRKLYGMYVPVFVQWADTWVANGRGKGAYVELLKLIKREIRKECKYVTVSQNDQGISGGRQDIFDPFDHPNFVDLSAGGYGKIPIPLLKQEEAQAEVFAEKAKGQKHVLLGFAGQMHGPRSSMVNKLRDAFATDNAKAFSVEQTLKLYHGSKWREIYGDSVFCFLPRGFGRSSFSLYEAVQIGTCIPIYVYTDLEWLPYRNTSADLHHFGMSIHASQIGKLPSVLHALSPSKRVDMLQKMRSLRSSHYTFKGVMDQIAGFLTGGTTDLRASNKRPERDH